MLQTYRLVKKFAKHVVFWKLSYIYVHQPYYLNRNSQDPVVNAQDTDNNFQLSVKNPQKPARTLKKLARNPVDVA